MRAPVMPNGWPTRDRAAVDVEPVQVDAEVRRQDGMHLGGERLVDLHQVDVVDGHAGARQRPPGRLDRAEAHDLRRQRRRPRSTTIRASGVMPSSARLAVAHDDQRGRAVVERAAVAGGDRAVRPEHRLQRRPAPRASRRAAGRRRRDHAVPSGSVTGVISRAQKPSAIAFSARFWLSGRRTRPASARVTPRSAATFSAVWPIAM